MFTKGTVVIILRYMYADTCCAPYTYAELYIRFMSIKLEKEKRRKKE